MQATESVPQDTKLIAGWLCLDFANTMDWHASSSPVELLPTYDHLAVWAHGAGILDATTLDGLRRNAAERPAEAEALRERAAALREALYRVFSAHARGGEPEPADLDLINRELANAHAHLRLVRRERAFAWEWTVTCEALDRIIWPIARSAAELLISPDLARVRECAGDGCGWLFVDTSRNHSRRWCSMESCGNRAKARRHYQRTRSAANR